MTPRFGFDGFQGFSLAEVLAVLAPGATFVLSCCVWLTDKQWSWILDRRSGEGSLFITVSFVLLSYVAGLVISVWAAHGWLWYVGVTAFFPARSRAQKVLFAIPIGILWLLHGWQHNLQRGRDIEMRKELYTYIRKKCGERVLLSIRPFDFFYFFRIIAWGDVQTSEESMLFEANALFRRRLFCYGVSLAILLGGLQAGIRLFERLPRHIENWSSVHTTLAALCIGGVLGSFLLRVVAFRLFLDEATYTYALFHQRFSKTI
jgi:hypothetical protein